MKITGIVGSTLLALPFLFFGGIYFIHPPALPPAKGQPGFEMLHLMRENGLSIAVAVAHLVTGVLLVVPRTRFVGAILQLPVTLAIVSFHYFMERMGLPIASVLVLLNILALADPARWHAMMAPTSKA